MSINEIMRIVFGVFCLVTGGLVIILIILDDILMMVATLSIALGLLSVFMVYDARVEREKKLQEEVRRKLTMIKLENDTNLALIERLKERIEKLYPLKLEKKKLKQSGKPKYSLTLEEINLIRESKLWIQKQHCSYSYALQVVEIGHHLDDTFIETIKEYTDKLRALNSQKDFIQWWILDKGVWLNPDEMHNLRTRINEADKISKGLKDMIVTEIENWI